MSDEEIKKALECCSRGVYAEVCDKCSFKEDGNIVNLNCLNLEKYALDLINRQQAEIEKLQSLCTAKDVIIKEQEAEIERLKYLLKYEESKYDRCAKQFYKAGVKEFAERLRLRVIKTRFDAMYGAVIEISNDTITELVKEMVGGENA